MSKGIWSRKHSRSFWKTTPGHASNIVQIIAFCFVHFVKRISNMIIGFADFVTETFNASSDHAVLLRDPVVVDNSIKCILYTSHISVSFQEKTWKFCVLLLEQLGGRPCSGCVASNDSELKHAKYTTKFVVELRE